jgi:hypothetical protein
MWLALNSSVMMMCLVNPPQARDREEKMLRTFNGFDRPTTNRDGAAVADFMFAASLAPIEAVARQARMAAG